MPGAPVPGVAAPGAPVPRPAPSASPAKPRPGPTIGAITLGLGIVLLILGAASQVTIIVIGGLVAAAWGMWHLVTGTGTKPPGQT